MHVKRVIAGREAILGFLPELAASAETWRQGWELADLPAITRFTCMQSAYNL
jgi:hypothetical protein